jgi:thymidine phosphorylase
MSSGIFFFVVGPSGAGKDSLIEGARVACASGQLADLPDVVFARRVITRAAGSPGEDHDALDEVAFAAQRERGAFLITWEAHGLSYGLRRDLLDALANGRHVIANGSRNMVSDLAARVPRLVVIEVTAPAEVLAARILSRGRETPEQVHARVMRQVHPLHADVNSIEVANDGSLADGVIRFIAALRTAMESAVMFSADMSQSAGSAPTFSADRPGAEGTVATPSAASSIVSADSLSAPPSRDAMAHELAGGALNQAQYAAILDDILAFRYADDDVNRFLTYAAEHLTDAEVLALAKVRASVMAPIVWPTSIVVDKHSMGGIPGSRITLIVVPIVAAFGLTMPKTSSRAITSAAGTADAMETVARVDLTADEVKQVVAQAGACIAWNGRLNHSLIDDRINQLTRPLALNSNKWSVASILSKKVSAGATHVIVDIPCGPWTKLKTVAEGESLAALFEYVGQGLGLHVKALVTDGTAPIGHGVGPALEVRDVYAVLDNDSAAPRDLIDKALTFASHILAWSPDVGSVAAGREVAASLLASGAARQAFERIVDAQGRQSPRMMPGTLTHTVYALLDGIVVMDGWQIAAIARAAGAPAQPGAGIDLLVAPGQAVKQGTPLFRIHAEHADTLAMAIAAVNQGADAETLPSTDRVSATLQAADPQTPTSTNRASFALRGAGPRLSQSTCGVSVAAI